MGHSANTERGYRADRRAYDAWCATEGVTAFPAPPEQVARYLRACSEVAAPATVARRLAGIVAASRAAGLASPRESPVVREALASVEWRHRARRRPTVPLDVESLARMSLCLPPTARGARDRAVLLLGYGAALRRTELVALDAADLTVTPRGGLRVRLARGEVVVPAGTPPHLCATRAWEQWSRVAATPSGPAFRPIDRHGNVRPLRLSDRAVTGIVQAAAALAGLDPARWSGRSLRVGMVQAAAATGASDLGIMAHTGHRTRRLVRGYRIEAATARR